MINTDKENQKTNSNNEKKLQDGLPEVADLHSKNNIKLILIISAVVLLGLYGFYHGHKSNQLADKSNESFHVQNEPAPLTISNSTDTNNQNVNQKVNNTQPNQAANAADAQKALIARIQSPIMMNSDQNQSVNNSSPNQAVQLQQPTAKNDDINADIDPNTKYMNQVSNQDVDTNNATTLKHLDTLIAQGNLINAVLESAINSDLPGYLRAIVSEPVYSEDGSQILIPAGSRLIGQYKSGMLTGQNRIFIVWTRVIEPNGISVQLGSPDVDSLGEAGLGADSVDYHFWQMFGTATLLSILGAGASNVGVSESDQYNASQAYRQAVSSSLAQSTQNALQQNTSIPPTLHIKQGTPIIVFVAKDLRFDNAVPNAMQKVHVF